MVTVNLQSNHAIFAGLTSCEMSELFPRLRLREYRTGEYIFNTKRPANYLFLLASGLVRLTYIAPDGDNNLLDICEEGDIFGEMFIGAYPFRIGDAQAMNDVQVYLLHEEELYYLIETYPQIGINFIRHLSDSKRRLFSRLHALQRTKAKWRVLGTLISLARTMCCTEGHRFVLNQAITQQDIADMTGLNRSTVSSLINRLREKNIMGGSGRYLYLDVPRMEALFKDKGFELLE